MRVLNILAKLLQTEFHMEMMELQITCELVAK